MELRPRNEQEIPVGLENKVGVERWTSLDQSLRDIPMRVAGSPTCVRAAPTKTRSYAG